jgi:hypothetical protein
MAEIALKGKDIVLAQGKQTKLNLEAKNNGNTSAKRIILDLDL